MLKHIVAATLLIGTVFGSAADAKTYRTAAGAAKAFGAQQLKVSTKQLIAIRYFDGGRPSGDAHHPQYLVSKGNIANAPSVGVTVTKLKKNVFVIAQQ